MQESVNALEIGGIVRLFSVIIRGTFLIEGIGAVLLAIRFIPDFGILRGIYFSVFHSISAFCNAGFDLMGINEEYSSFTKYAADPLVNITIMLLIIIGGIGFTIWNEVRIKKFKLSRYSLHAKIVISTTLILVFGGGLFMYILKKQYHSRHGHTGCRICIVIRLSYGENGRLQYSRHSSTDTGEQAFDYSAHVHRRKPGLDSRWNQNHNHGGHDNLYCFVSERMQRLQCVWQEISSEVIKKAGMVLIINLVLGLTAVIAILATSNMKMDDVLFEVYSAISTVGMTTGITRDLNTVGRIIIIIMMYCGRIGSMTFVLSFVHRPDKANIELPEEKVIIG